jgi:hypothetical protein
MLQRTMFKLELLDIPFKKRGVIQNGVAEIDMKGK